MELWELTAREAIRELVASYAHAADRGRFDDLLALFAPDGALEIDDDRKAVEHAAIKALLTGAGTDLRSRTERPLVRHHTSNLHITVEGMTQASGVLYFFVVTERGPDHWGRYQDTYVLIDGHWRFQRRRVRLDGWAPGSWAAQSRGQR